MLDQSFEALKSFDWGSDPATLKAIDDAIVASQNDSATRGELEGQLLEVLKSDAPDAAKDYAFRKLMAIGTATSVAQLGPILGDDKWSHRARFALERIPGPEASAALRKAAGALTGPLQAGVITSLGVRQDADAVKMLGELLADNDPVVATAAARALGAVRSADAAELLGSAKPNPAAVPAAVDASLACAEQMVKSGNPTDALAIYKRIAASKPPKHVQLAATRGMLACVGAGS
jgi:hypothetical protein